MQTENIYTEFITVGVIKFKVVYVEKMDKVMICSCNTAISICCLYSREDLRYLSSLIYELYHDLYVLALSKFPKQEITFHQMKENVRTYAPN